MKPFFITTFLCLIAIPSLTRSEKLTLPDTRQGQIDGKVAVLFWPVSAGHKVEDIEHNNEGLLSPDHCQVHLVPATNMDAELLFPCGVWFQPPDGRYRTWLEKGDLIAESPMVMNYVREPFSGRGQGVIVPVVPGGRVALSNDVGLDETRSFRALRIDAPYETVTRSFDRRGNEKTARSGLLLPVGVAVAGIFDHASNDAIALTRPLRVTASTTAVALPRRPNNGADLLLVLDRPALKEKSETTFTLDVDGTSHVPDVLLEAADRVFAIWYGVDGRSGRLTTSSKYFSFPTREVRLLHKHVVTIRGKLDRLPSVGVTIHAPPGAFKGEEVSIEARQPDAATSIRRVPASFEKPVRLESLPAQQLDIVLLVGPWQFKKSVDLIDNSDEFPVIFDLQPIVVSGVVYYGRNRVAGAEVRFEGDHGWIRNTTSADGRYSIELWKPSYAYMAEITVPGRTGPPYEDGFLSIQESRTLDFHIPATHYVIHVTDSVTGLPIAGASVRANNAFQKEEGEARIAQTAVTDAQGDAELPPLRVGNVHFSATAKGYRDSAPVEAAVGSVEDNAKFTISLRPIGDTLSIQVLGSEGRAAPGAEIWAVRTAVGDDPPLWHGSSNDDGMIDVPVAYRSSLMLVRHPSNGSCIRKLDDENTTWRLPPAGPALAVRVGSRTHVAVWLNGIPVSGIALTFLSWSSYGGDARGIWMANNLPPEPIWIIAWRNLADSQFQNAGIDPRAKLISYPRPPVFDLEPVD
jgi:carboxypeptidase family protein